MALPRGATGLSAVCDCGISRSYLLTILEPCRRDIICPSLRETLDITEGLDVGPRGFGDLEIGDICFQVAKKHW